MHITSVELAVTDPAATAAWYATVLGLPTSVELPEPGQPEPGQPEPGRPAAGPVVAVVTIGSSTLRLTTALQRPHGHHHVAFTVPGDGIGAAHDWLVDRVGVMSVAGSDVVAGPPEWDSESVYFPGPDGSILELIARHRLPPAERAPTAPGPGPFGPGSLLSISEIRVPVADVPAIVGRLGSVLGLRPFGEPGQRFAAVGDDDGLLIVVESGRTWFPTDHYLPDDGPLNVRVSAALGATLHPDQTLQLGVDRTVTSQTGLCPERR